MEDAALDSVIQDVAARIIQTYWRTYKLNQRAVGVLSYRPTCFSPRSTLSLATAVLLHVPLQAQKYGVLLSPHAGPGSEPTAQEQRVQAREHAATQPQARQPAAPNKQPKSLPASPVPTRTGRATAQGVRSTQPASSLRGQTGRKPQAYHSVDSNDLVGIVQRAPAKGAHKVYTISVAATSRTDLLSQVEDAGLAHKRASQGALQDRQQRSSGSVSGAAVKPGMLQQDSVSGVQIAVLVHYEDEGSNEGLATENEQGRLQHFVRAPHHKTCAAYIKTHS